MRCVSYNNHERVWHTSTMTDEKKAARCMGLPSGDLSSLGEVEKRFSDDVLKIEIAGPDHHHLSVVDVPGLFHSKTT